MLKKKLIYFPWCYQAGIIRIAFLFETEQNCFLSFNSLCKGFNKKFNFLQYLQYPFIHSALLEKVTRF